MTANPGLIQKIESAQLPEKYNLATGAQVLYRYIIDASGGQPLSGCKQDQQNAEAVWVQKMRAGLEEADIQSIETWMYGDNKRRRNKERREEL